MRNEESKLQKKMMFDIPIVLFTFKRTDTVLRIIDRIKIVAPKKIYILSDGPRNQSEEREVFEARKVIRAAIDWECDVVENYADRNIGVYERIGQGAQWVFRRERSAIFLEDDNLPAVSFFKYCEELLVRHEFSSDILWITGTNYLGKYVPKENQDYVYTRHLLPCGWASWASKFTQFYDGELKNLTNSSAQNLRSSFFNMSLYRQERLKYFKTKYLLSNDRRKSSWDAQMGFSIRYHGMYGIAPCYNQIENIGVDAHSIHHGNNWKNEMTRRFCGIGTTELVYPLAHPENISIDEQYERLIENIVLYPLIERIQIRIATIVKPILGINKFGSFKEIVRSWRLR